MKTYSQPQWVPTPEYLAARAFGTKTPATGTAPTHVVFEPLDFIARLAALVPRPRAHLTRYHGGVRAPQPVAGGGHAGGAGARSG